MKYKAVMLDYDYFALLNKSEIIFLDSCKIINRKNSDKKLEDGQIVDTKSWKLDREDHFLTREELSKIWFGYQNLGF